MIACKNCKWLKEWSYRNDGFTGSGRYCNHPSCFRDSFDPVKGVKCQGDRKRVKVTLTDDEGEFLREEWANVGYDTKNKTGECPDFEMQPPKPEKKKRRGIFR